MLLFKIWGSIKLSSLHIHSSSFHRSSTDFTVGLGDYNVSKTYGPKSEVTLNVKKVFVHPNYMAGTFDNDLALLELDSPVTFQEHILPICLPTIESKYVGVVATVAGWRSLMHGEEEA